MKSKLAQGQRIEVSAGSQGHRGVATRVYATLERGAKDAVGSVVAKMKDKPGIFVFDANQVNRAE